MYRYCKPVWVDEEQSLLMTSNGKFVVEECVRFDAPNVYLCDTFVDAVSCLCNLKWSLRFHWSRDDVEYFIGKVDGILENWDDEEDDDAPARGFPITTVKELRELKELLCWDAWAPHFDYMDEKGEGDNKFSVANVECYEVCTRVCSQAVRERYIARHGCICGACSRKCKCYKAGDCDAHDND